MRLVSRNAKRITIVLALFCTSCAHDHDWTKLPGDAMDRVAQGLEEYGYVTMSAPLFSRPDPVLTFDFKYSSDKYFADAKKEIQGAAASYQQMSQVFALGVAVQADPVAMASYAAKLRQYTADQSRIDQKQSLVDSAAKIEYLTSVQKATADPDPEKKAAALAAADRAYAQSLSPPSTSSPSFPNLSSSSNVPPATSGLAKQPSDALSALSSGKFKDFQGLLSSITPSLTPTVSNRSALVTAAGDQAVEGIFKILGNQGDAQKFKDKTLLLGVTMVSVDPGWRTREDFAADISVGLKYGVAKARKEVIGLLLRDNNLSKGLRKKIASDYDMENSLPDELKKDYKALIMAAAKTRDQDKAKLDESIKKTAAAIAQTDIKIKGYEKDLSNKKLSKKSRDQKTADLKKGKDSLKSYEEEKQGLEKQKTAADTAFKNKQAALHKEKKALEDQLNNCTIPVQYQLDKEQENDGFPLVSAISPMTETEALDLSSSVRSQEELALSLSFALRSAGLGAQAEAFEEFAKSRQLDVRTRSASAAINSYSSPGMFGFQIGPRLKAIADPSNTKNGPANVLERQSFPALIVIGFDREDLRPKLDIQGGRIHVYETNLNLVQSTSWLPMKNKWYTWAHNPRLTERERLEWSSGLADARREAKKPCEDDASSGKCQDYSGAKGLLETRIGFLKYHAFGSAMRVAIPAEMLVPLDEPKKSVVPKITEILPKEVALAKKADGSVEAKTATFVLTGAGLDAVNVKGIKIATGSAAFTLGKEPNLTGGVIMLTLDVKGGEAPIIFELPLDPAKSGLSSADEPVSVLSLPITVSVSTAPVVKADNASAKKSSKSISYDKTSDGAGKKDNVTITFDSGLSAQTITAAKSIIEADINRSKTGSTNSANVSVSVQAGKTTP